MSITDNHRDFVRAVVALARKHEIRDINMTFTDCFRADAGHAQVRAHWSTGRHESQGEIKVFFDAQERFSEEPTP